jgi:glycine cleavage system aminomethyltransferase T
MARDAQGRGARFFGQTKVTGIDFENGKVQGVNTSRGRIAAPTVVLSAGIWGPRLGRLAGVRIPLMPVQHQYARTSPLPELAGETREVSQPILRHQDRSMYFRQHADSYGIGSYLHEPLLVDPDSILEPEQASVMPSVMKFTPEHFQRALVEARNLLPPLGSAELIDGINGMFSFTPDGLPILGASLEARGFWVAEAVWIAHSGGVGKAMAEWMIDGVTSLDLRECDLNRFHEHAFTPEYVKARASQQYREVYDIIHPLQQIKFPRNLRLTPFHQRLVELVGVFFEGVGWERPQWFGSNERLLGTRDWPSRKGWEARYWSPVQGAEHVATRDNVALYDLTPFVKIDVRGPNALEFMQNICANQIDQPVGKVVYTSMLNRDAGIMCDLTVTRLAKDQFLVLTGGTTGMHDLAWIRTNMQAIDGVQVTDVTSNYCCVGVWGPKAVELVRQVSEDRISPGEFPSFTARRISIGSIPALALRVSYVGELGWEIYAQPSCGLALWDALWGAGESVDLVACGGGAFDSLRLEKGFRLWGADIHSEYNPYEAGIGFAVKPDKCDFLGREALLRIKDKGIFRKLTRIYFDEPDRVVMGKEPILTMATSLAMSLVQTTATRWGRGSPMVTFPWTTRRKERRLTYTTLGNCAPPL